MNLPKGFDDSLAIFVWLFMFGQPFQLIHVKFLWNALSLNSRTWEKLLVKLIRPPALPLLHPTSACLEFSFGSRITANLIFAKIHLSDCRTSSIWKKSHLLLQRFKIHNLLLYFSAKVLVKGEPNVSYICSRYYRAPELIFGATDYTPDIGTVHTCLNIP